MCNHNCDDTNLINWIREDWQLIALCEFFTMNGFKYFGTDTTLNTEQLYRNPNGQEIKADFIAIKAPSGISNEEFQTVICKVANLKRESLDLLIEELAYAKQHIKTNFAGKLAYVLALANENDDFSSLVPLQRRIEEQGFGVLFVYKNHMVEEWKVPVFWWEGKQPSSFDPTPKVCSEWQAQLMF